MSDIELQQIVHDLKDRLLACQMDLEQAIRRQSWLDAISDGYVQFNQALQPTTLNPAGERLYSLIHPPRAEAGAPLPTQVSVLEETLLHHVFASGQPATIGYQVWVAHQKRYIEARYFPGKVEDGAVQTVLAILRDDTGRRQVSESMQVNETLVRAAITHAGIRVYAQDRDLCYQWIYDQQYGLMDQAYPGKTDEDLYSEEDAQKLTRIKKQVLETGQSLSDTVDLTLKGEVRSYDLHIEPRKDAQGELVGLLCTSLDVTERRRAAQQLEQLVQANQTQEERLTHQNELLKTIFDANPAGMAVLSGDDLIHGMANTAYRMMLPHPEVDPIGRAYTDIWPPSENFRGSWMMQRVLQSGNPVQFDRYPQQFPDGTTHYYSIHLSRLVWEEQPAVLMVMWDVTGVEFAHQQAEQAAHEAQQRAAEAEESRRILEALMEYIPEGITIADAPDVKIRMVSRFGRELIGQQNDEVEGIPAEKHPEHWQIYYPNSGQPLTADQLPLTRATRKGELVVNEELILYNADGEPVPILCNAGPIRNQQGQITGGIIAWRDITDRKQTLEALRESEEKFRSAFANAAIGFSMATPDGQHIDANPAYCNLIGYSLEELQTMRIPQLIHPEDRDENMQRIDQMLAGEMNDYVIENRYIRKDGEVVWVRKSGSVIRNSKGAALWIVALVEDITERKHAEETKTLYAAQLEQVNRELEFANRELKDFAYIASHDLQEPLRKVSKFGEMLRNRRGSSFDEDEQDYLNRMMDAARRMQEMIHGLLDYSRISTRGNPFTQVNLDQIAQDVLSDLEIRIDQTGGTVELDPLPEIEADPLQMRQLLQNLISNALKFHQAGVKPLVKVWAEACANTGSLTGKKNRSIQLMVQDNGVGFDPQLAEKLFQPFIRLHGRSAFEGTGMGLAICRKIVERHGGKITVSTNPGQGTTFTVTLPVHQKPKQG